MLLNLSIGEPRTPIGVQTPNSRIQNPESRIQAPHAPHTRGVFFLRGQHPRTSHTPKRKPLRTLRYPQFVTQTDKTPPKHCSGRRFAPLAVIGPGLLVAATGVGAGDLATAALAGSELGLAIAWAVLIGAAIKLALTENLARHQIATGSTILESAITHLRWFVYIPFGLYLIAFSYFVGAALIAANAVALNAILAPGDESLRPALSVAATLTALTLALLGGFRLFERLMAACIAVMVSVVLAAAALSQPDLPALLKGLVLPTIPKLDDNGLSWTVALMGGVGGTLTILCYSYWMRDAGRTTPDHLRVSRIDITLAYAVTAIFGIAMLVIAAPLEPQGSGSRLIVNLADQLEASFSQTYGSTTASVARFAFLIGALGAVFSSMLGVWQAVPSIFTDWWNTRPRLTDQNAPIKPVSTKSATYRLFLVAIATVPLLSLNVNFASIQKIYAIVGAAFVPALALVLLILNNRINVIGNAHRNRAFSNTILGASLALAATLAILERVFR